MSWDIQKLFRRHAGDIALSLRRGGLTHEAAADLTQDTFLRVLASPPARAGENHNPEAYLFRVSRNLRIDHQRRERRAKRIWLTDIDLSAIADPSPSPEAVVYGRERLMLVEAALAELPARQRVAFGLHRIGDMTVSQVGEKLGVSTGTAWSLIRDAYEHIDARLTGK